MRLPDSWPLPDRATRALGAAWGWWKQTGARTGAPVDAAEVAAPTVDEAAALRREVTRNVLPFWRAHAVDERGGYVVHLERDGTPYDRVRRFAAMQARMVYTFAIGERLEPGAGHARLAEHGVRFLEERFLDTRHGGYRHTLDRGFDEKRSFDQAYVCIGLCAWAAVSGDPRAKARVEATVESMERLWDRVRGGYAERGDRTFRVKRAAKTACIQLDMLAALLDIGELSRARELGDVIVGRLLDRPSGLVLEEFTAQWRYNPVPTRDTVVIGHNWKAVTFLLKLGEPRFRDAALAIAERSLERGWDLEHGGFFHDVYRVGGVASNVKIWWTNAEAISALYGLYAATGQPRWLALARRQADWCRRHHQDPAGSWITSVERDGTPHDTRKGGDYKAALHEAQAWLLASEAIERTSVADETAPDRGARRQSG